MKAITLHHPLADIKIQPLVVCRVIVLKKIIQDALDSYVESETVALSEVRTRMQERHGSAFQTPGYYLRVYRTRADLTQTALAKQLAIKQHHISEMECNKRTIGKALAKKLAAILRCDYHKFL